MKAIREHVHGTLLTAGDRTALLLKNSEPEEETADSLFLRFAFVTQGPEEHLLPAFLLDDWGGEIKGLALYEWVAEFGPQFPRAELFGFMANGQAAQRFLREFELYVRLPCYAYPRKETPLTEGRIVEVILLPDMNVLTPQKISRPSHLKRPLRSAKVSWWQVNPATTAFDFTLLDAPSD